MVETPIIWFTSVDSLLSKNYSDFIVSLLRVIMNNLDVLNYRTKNCLRAQLQQGF